MRKNNGIQRALLRLLIAIPILSSTMPPLVFVDRVHAVPMGQIPRPPGGIGNTSGWARDPGTNGQIFDLGRGGANGTCGPGGCGGGGGLWGGGNGGGGGGFGEGGGLGGGGGPFGGGGGPFGGLGGNGQNLLASAQFLMMLMSLFNDGSNTQQSGALAIFNLNQTDSSNISKPGQPPPNSPPPQQGTTKPSTKPSEVSRPVQKPGRVAPKPGRGSSERSTVSSPPAEQPPGGAAVVESQPPIDQPSSPSTGTDGRPSGSFFERDFVRGD